MLSNYQYLFKYDLNLNSGDSTIFLFVYYVLKKIEYIAMKEENITDSKEYKQILKLN